jgi:glutathione S-transferase
VDSNVDSTCEHKGVPYDQDFVDLRDKPEWYTDMVPTGMVPAARFASDGALVWESAELLRELEARFPEAPPLIPADPGERARMEAFVEAEADGDDTLVASGFRYLVGGRFGEEPDPARLPELQEAFEQALERRRAHFQGPGFAAGGAQMTLADVVVAPGLERLCADLPVFRGFDLRAEIGPWLELMEALPAYQRVRSDPETHVAVVRKIFQAKGDGRAVPLPAAPPEVAPGAAAEAAERLSASLEAVKADVLKNAGVTEADAEAVEAHLRMLAAHLADCPDPAARRPFPAVPDPPPAGPPAEGDAEAAAAAAAARARARAAGAAALAFVRGRVSAPRDMSAAAAAALRAACAACLAGVYP